MKQHALTILGYAVATFAVFPQHYAAIDDFPTWVAVELSSGFMQFTLIGVFLWLAHRSATHAWD